MSALRAALPRIVVVIAATALIGAQPWSPPSASPVADQDGRAATQPPASTAPAARTAAGSGLQTVALDVPQARARAGIGAPPVPHAHDGRHRKPAAVTERMIMKPFQLAAVTWNAGQPADVAVWVRTRAAGRWTGWFEVPHGDDHAPDPGAAEAAQARGGTDPLVVSVSDGVQVRVDSPDGRTPRGLRLDLIDPGIESAGRQSEQPELADLAVATTPDDDAEGRAASRPAIHTRAQWGADESLRGPDLTYAQVRGGFVHHTVSASNYTPAEVPAIIRGIYRYHVLSRGWNDIGYNFLVDRFGRIWEGRFGGVKRPVVGAHTSGYNDDAFAMSAIGTYTSKGAEPVLVNAYQRLFAWKFTVHGVDPRRPVNYDGERWPAVAGHRDASSTLCPGDGLYARLPSIRDGVVAIMYGPLPSLQRSHPGVSAPDLVVRRRPDGSLWRFSGRGGAPQLIGTSWNSMDLLAAPGDVNGDGWPDLVARKASNGTLWFYAGRADGHLNSGKKIGAYWQTMSIVIGAGDWTGDRRGDLIARRSPDGSLWLYPGLAGGGHGTPHRIGSGWKTMNMLAVPGDLTGDGRRDLIARRISDGTLWLYPGRGGAPLGRPKLIGNRWNTMSAGAGADDWNRDGRGDLIARDRNGTLWFYAGQVGRLSPAREIGRSWNAFDILAMPH